MEALQLRKAERRRAKVRIGISGPSGSGKTYSALLLAKGLVGDWSKIALIDTEEGRGELYSDLGGYNYLRIRAPFNPEKFVEVMTFCEESGMEAIIIDSATHEWDGPGGCKSINDSLAQMKYKGNTWAAWNETTPRHDKFIYSIVQSKCHVISTTRSKTETAMGEGKKVYKVGLKDLQRDGFEYEFTVFFNIDRETHVAMASKDNTRIFEGKEPSIISEATGKIIREWCESGAESLEEIEAKKKAKFRKKLIGLGEGIEEWVIKNYGPVDQMSAKKLESIVTQLEEKKKKKEEEENAKSEPKTEDEKPKEAVTAPKKK